MVTLVSSAPIDITLIKMAFAVKYKELASNSISKKASAKDAMKDTQSSMASVKKSMSTKLPLLDVPFGLTVNAKPAQKDGTSTLIELVSQLVISAPLGMRLLEPAQPATMDLLCRKEIVSLTLIPALFLKVTSSAKFGIKKFVLNALIEPSLTLMASVSQLAHNVTLLTRPLVIV